MSNELAGRDGGRKPGQKTERSAHCSALDESTLDSLRRAEARVRRAARPIRDARRLCRHVAEAVPVEVRRAFASEAVRAVVRARDDLHLAARAVESVVAALAGEILD